MRINIVLVMSLVFLMACESEQAKEKRVRAAIDSCVEDAVSGCESACRSDPKTAYCGIVYMGRIAGSGCAEKIDSLSSYTDKVDKCVSSACSSVKYEAKDACFDKLWER